MLKLAVFGNPISHSRSPGIHKAFAHQAGIQVDYQKILVPLGDFTKVVQTFIQEGGSGFNITSPCKDLAFLLARQHSPRAELAQAVNTMVVHADGNCYGDNTDGVGFIRDLVVNKHFLVADKRIVLHGAGGAMRGIIPALLAQKPQQLWLFNRTEQTARDLAELGPIQAVAYGSALIDIDLLIDGSSSACQQFAGLEALQFSVNAHAYDLKYAAVDTAFIAWAKARGIKHCHDGFGMLIEQAALSFYLWTGFMPDTQLLKM